MTCPNCQSTDHQPEAKYCCHCGASLTGRECPICHSTDHLPEAKFCFHCGASLPFEECPTCHSTDNLPEATFCSHCGSSLNKNKEEFPSDETASKPAHLSPVINQLIDNMVEVKGGTFFMGATSEQKDDCENDEMPVHQVTLSTFSIGRYPVTQKEWKEVMGTNPSIFERNDQPVENVSWDDCQEFIQKLNKLTGMNFRLPTEAEWEFAARGGKESENFIYSGDDDLDEVAWFYENSGDVWADEDEWSEDHLEEYQCRPQPVGQKLPNELELYDMSGNVWEWCSDWYGRYDSSFQTNPTGPETGSYRIKRGGAWYNKAESCRVSYRGNANPTDKECHTGFRLAL